MQQPAELLQPELGEDRAPAELWAAGAEAGAARAGLGSEMDPYQWLEMQLDGQIPGDGPAVEGEAAAAAAAAAEDGTEFDGAEGGGVEAAAAAQRVLLPLSVPVLEELGAPGAAAAFCGQGG